MPIRDTFPHNGRWEAVDLDCAYCVHFVGPRLWPDTARSSRCALHGASLAVELDRAGFKEGEWFCRDFTKAPGSFVGSADAIAHLDQMRDQLKPRVLYGFHGADGNLKEHELSPRER